MRLPLLLAAALCVQPVFAALEVPAGSEIEIRLKTKVSTGSSKPGDPVETVVISPVVSGSQYLIPAGALLSGTIEKSVPPPGPNERAVLSLRFSEIAIDGTRHKISAQIAGVDNAREKLDEEGQINGILASETVTARLDSGIDKVAEKYSGLAGILRAAKSAILKPADTSITYDAGVEMTLRLLAPLALTAPAGAGPAANTGPISNAEALAALVAKEPFQTVAQNPPKPSDLTNLMILGSAEAIQRIFHDAGWTAAAGLTGNSKLETFRALAEDRGYNEAPVSVLLLDGQPPDLVFEKLNNTFAQRHHLRIWRRPETLLGRPLWAIAATHDTGISFSETDRTFIHRIDSQIDKERAKVVADLLFTGQVEGIDLIDRPNVPLHSENATGDRLETDGKLAVLLLR